jgi:hypothetical protein
MLLARNEVCSVAGAKHLRALHMNLLETQDVLMQSTLHCSIQDVH